MEQNEEPNEEKQLWESFLDGSDRAFSSIYKLYFRLLYNYGGKFTADKDVVKDAIQDLFVRLWERREELREVKSPKFYLLKAMRHRMLDALAREKKLVSGADMPEDEFEFVPPHEALLISYQLTQEQEESVLKALNSLTPRQKEAIFLRFYNNLSYEEIATLMSLTVDSSYNLISRALSAIKANIIKIGLMLLFLFS